VFQEYGNIERINLIMDRETGKSKGFGFIYFERLEDSIRAYEATRDRVQTITL
jgi:RNA recognition motif-containing protein